MPEPVAPASSASVIESVRFTRQSNLAAFCHSERFVISWTTPAGIPETHASKFCLPCDDKMLNDEDDDFEDDDFEDDEIVVGTMVAPHVQAVVLRPNADRPDYEARIAVFPRDFGASPNIFPAPIEKLSACPDGDRHD